jgi:hypothetical protein
MSKLILAGLFVVAAAIALTQFQGGENQKQFMETAKKASAIITEKEERVVDMDSGRKEYWVSYQFSDDKGVSYSVDALVENQGLWNSLEQNQKQDVYYNPAQPSDNYLAVVLDGQNNAK